MAFHFFTTDTLSPSHCPSRQVVPRDWCFNAAITRFDQRGQQLAFLVTSFKTEVGLLRRRLDLSSSHPATPSALAILDHCLGA